jgi:chromate transporter
VQRLQNMPRLSSALSCITAAVAGVILNLSLWFGLHVLFAEVHRLSGPIPLWWPDFSRFDVAGFTLSIIAGLALLKFNLGVPKTLALAGTLGVIWKFVVPLI